MRKGAEKRKREKSIQEHGKKRKKRKKEKKRRLKQEETKKNGVEWNRKKRKLGGSKVTGDEK